MGFRTNVKDKLRVENIYIREFFAELLGTFILVIFGDGSVAQSVLSREAQGEFLSINLSWGLAVAMAVWVSGGVTGGHVNPAITLAMVIMGRLHIKKLLVYWAAQYLGAFVAAAFLFGVYHEALDNFDGGVRQVYGENATAGIFATYPQAYLSISAGFGDQVFGTMMLAMCVMAITDVRNTTPPRGLLPLCVGYVVTVIGMSIGSNAGYAINPARDFSPRSFTAMAGWGGEVFSAYNYYFWIPLVAPHFGAIAGAWIYLVFVGIHLEKKPILEDDQIPDESIKPTTNGDVNGMTAVDMSAVNGTFTPIHDEDVTV